MYYGSGNYEAFAHPVKPEGVDGKSAYIIGTGLAGLSAAFFLVRDGQMKGEHIHLLEKLDIAGGSCDGRAVQGSGFYMRGGREMDNHFEVMWEMFRDVPSLENPGLSVLDEYYRLNKADPNYSLCRATVNRGENAHTDNKFNLNKEAAMQVSKLFMTPEEELEDKKISDYFDDNFWQSNFWLYWQTMFAFHTWDSALEMKRYLQRYVHHIDGLPDFSALRFTKYNQYESLIQPLQKYLENHGVKTEYGIDVKNVVFDINGKKKTAKKIEYVKNGEKRVHRSSGKRPCVYYQRLLHGYELLRRSDARARPFEGEKGRRRIVGFVEKHRDSGPRVRQSFQLLRPPGRNQLDERDGGNRRRGNYTIYRENLPPRSSRGQSYHGRHRYRERQRG